ncbi:MAG: 3-phosphoshikimate 1-carboxyvinyltransferase [Frankiaceae bacterium]|nr:3-phosphoshikimate 1-carboxyvinyltransferase [Frankiaceae bacterium]
MIQPGWPAPAAIGAVHATVAVPGSKSMTNRALLCAALADGRSRVRRPLVSRDSALMTAGLGAFGARFEPIGRDLLVTGVPPPFRLGSAPLHVEVGLSGTVTRFLPPVAALSGTSIGFDGDEHMRSRPIGRLLTALRELGAEIDDDGRGALPFVVNGRGRVAGGSVTVDASQSSQLVSGLLLAAPYFDAGVDVHLAGDLPSAPHVAMTVAMMRRAGADVDAAPARWRVLPGAYESRDVEIEPDATSASYFFAAAAITGGTVTVPDWPHDSVQPSDHVLGVLTAMGVRFEYADGALTAIGPGTLTGIDVDMHDISEVTPTVAVLAAVAAGPTRIRGVGHIRLHETDRLAALAAEINRLGGDVNETDDGLEIRPRPLTGGRWETYADHRLAMSGAVLGLVVPGIEIVDIGCTSKTMPDFAERWLAMAAGG